ncbi:hypothetical protein [Butyrivibrio sp. WCE2006]|uniref:hypothetical protein n=1 Tax=Butyrivibrio sp. WCE2006 TaxID=1410611 RepID=UPI0012DC55AD|nr:hypothetical protein [Butyrivibrio sp. WCE2006]
MHTKKLVVICLGVVVAITITVVSFGEMSSKPEPLTNGSGLNKEVTFDDIKSCGWVDCF